MKSSNQYVRAVLSLGVLVAGAGACELIASVDRTLIPTEPVLVGGGLPSGGGGSGAGMMVGGGGSGGTMCNVDNCDDPDPNDCQVPACVDNACGFENADERDMCMDGDARICDANGNCVECIDSGDCTDGVATECDNGQCVPATCQNGAIDPGETDIDCGDNDMSGCAPCENTRNCDANDDCLSGYCAAGQGMGGAPGTGECRPCESGGTGDGNGECDAGQWCDAGVCEAQKAIGLNCSAGDFECDDGTAGTDPGNCVDGFCCDGACDGTCERCDAVNKESGVGNGSCGPAATSDPDNECTAGTAACTTDSCSGTSAACGQAAMGTSCGADVCMSGMASTFACDNTGSCEQSDTNCDPYVCGGTSCRADCATNGDSDCADQANDYCNDTSDMCVPKVGNGQLCDGDNACSEAGDTCEDGVCCDEGAPCGQCFACDVSGQEGACVALPALTNDGCSAMQACNGSGACQGTIGAMCNISTESNDCISNACSGQPGTCLGATGEACSMGTQCASGTCTGMLCD